MLVRVESVYDGDTLTVLMVDNGIVYRRRCRCIGYDAPEMRGPHADKVAACAARDHLRSVLPDTVFPMTYNGFDKYGRLLVTCDIRDKGSKGSKGSKGDEGVETLAAHMIRCGHGYAYDGGTKLVRNGS